MTTNGESCGFAAPTGDVLASAARIVATLLLVFAPAQAGAGDFDVAVQAAEAGDFDTALREFEALAAGGDPRGENGLGVLYLRGHGLERDPERAFALFRSAAEKGLRAAETGLRRRMCCAIH